MIEQLRINYPSTAYGVKKYHLELQQAILDGYSVSDESWFKSLCWWGGRHAITLFKDVGDPLDALKDPKLKLDEVKAIAKDNFGIEVPSNINLPNSAKKFIKEELKAREEAQSAPEEQEEEPEVEDTVATEDPTENEDTDKE